MKNKKLGILVLVILTIVIGYYLLKDNYREIFYSILNANFLWILLAICFYGVYTVLQAIPFYDFSRIYKKDVSFKYMIYLIIATNFFNGITPLATGGQPFQVYELHRHGIPTVNASNVVIQNFIVFQLSLVIWSLISLVLNKTSHLLLVSVSLRNLFLIGFILNVGILAFALIACLSKNFIRKVIFFIIRVLSKLHVVKNEEKQIETWDKTCTEFHSNFKMLYNNKWLLIKNVFVLLLAFVAYYSIPFCILKALHITTYIPYIATLVMSSFVYMSSSYMPIPGATGGMEYSFLGFFGHYIKGYKLNTILLLWRFTTYYLPTIFGGIVFGSKRIKNSTSK